MNGEKLMEYLGDIDEAFIREAAPGNRPAKRRWPRLAGAAAVLVVAAAGARGLWGPPEPDPCRAADPEISCAAEPSASWETIGGMEPGNFPEDIAIGDAPGYVRWHGYDYFDHGNAAYEFPEGLELLGETDQVVPEGGLLPEDAGDLSANINGWAYWFPGNEDVIVFRYKDWDTSYAAVELGRREPFLIMYREPMESAQGESGYYGGISEMVLDADVIVEGAAVPVEPEAESGDDVYTVQVANVLAGDVEAEEELRVRVPADSGRLERSGENTYLLFLRRDGDGFRPVSEVQGVYATVRQGKGEYVLVPNIESYMVFSQGAIRNPPYTHVSYSMYGVRKQIQRIAGAEALPSAQVSAQHR